MVRKLVLAVAAAGALMSSNMVQALGVGEINLRSALNQPLDAEIELLQVRDLSGTEIRSVLASPDDFGRAGIDRAFFLTDLTFTPVIQPGGKAYIRVTSSRPVKEPYLNFLMEVRWPSGRVLREFTLLLDPPLYDPTPVTFSAPVAPRATANTGAVRAPAPASVPAPARSSAPFAAPAPRVASPGAPAATDGQRRTTRADTLWAIALEARPQGSNVHQTMLAIQDLNPSAFIGNNINSLKAGQVLTLPSAEQAAVRSGAEAIAEVNRQTSAWQNRQPASEPAQRQLDARERSVAGDAPAQTPAADTLRLVAGSTDSSDESLSSSGGQNGGLRETLDQTKEQLDSSEREKAELIDRLAAVEGQLETVQRLIALKDAQLAALQRDMAEQSGLPDVLPVPEDVVGAEGDLQEQAVAELPTDEASAQADEVAVLGDPASEVIAEDAIQQPSDSQEAGDADEEQVALLPAATPDQQVDAGSNPQNPPQAAAPSNAPVAPAAQPADAQNNSPEALLQRFMQNQTLLLATGAVALLALLLILMSIARRNARREAELTENYLAQRIPTPAAEGDEGDDFNVAIADAQSEADPELAFQSDPLVEADELIINGQLDEAAGVLEAAIEQEPERTDLRLKMMEVEARRENQVGYAAQLQALREIGMADSAIEMMNARYPLMAAGLVTGVTLLYTSTDSDYLDDDVPARPQLDDDNALEEPSLLDGDSTDFDFADFGLEEDTAASLADSTGQEADFDLDFDLDEGSVADDFSAQTRAADASAELEAAPVSPLAEPVEDDFSLDLDEELQADNLLAEFEALSRNDEPAPAADVSELDVDGEGGLTLTDDDLAGFEAQLQTAMQEDAGAGVAGGPFDQSDDIVDFGNAGAGSEGLMSEGLDEDFDFLSDTDECATKLDLARAYIDMGDEEGARDILTEVVEEGTDQQQQDARELMGQLG